ncbi:MAG TPA: hypothetical protein VIV60_01305 [Polyangiaceae bacterium]
MVTFGACDTPQPMEDTASTKPHCSSCGGAGEIPTDFGPTDCPDCGGAGYLPEKHALVEWRLRDIERAVGSGLHPAPVDLRWLLSELRQARTALNEVVALAHDAEDPDGIAMKIRVVASRVLGL